MEICLSFLFSPNIVSQNSVSYSWAHLSDMTIMKSSNFVLELGFFFLPFLTQEGEGFFISPHFVMMSCIHPLVRREILNWIIYKYNIVITWIIISFGSFLCFQLCVAHWLLKSYSLVSTSAFATLCYRSCKVNLLIWWRLFLLL